MRATTQIFYMFSSVLGVPKGKYLLKKNEKLQRRIKKLQKEFQNFQVHHYNYMKNTSHEETEENTQPYNLVADDISSIYRILISKVSLRSLCFQLLTFTNDILKVI